MYRIWQLCRKLLITDEIKQQEQSEETPDNGLSTVHV